MANVLEILSGLGSAFGQPAQRSAPPMSAAPALPSMYGQDPMAEQAARVGAMDFGPQTMQAAPLPPQAVQAPPMQEPAKKPRMSIIDIIGSIGNALSTGGGGEARYRTEAERARDEQARMAQEQDAELQRRMNQQKFQSGNIELATDQNKIIGQSVRGLRAVYDKNPAAIGRAWEFVSSQLGVPEQRRAEIAQALATDPEGTLAVLEGAMAEEQKGSKPKEVAIYELLRQNKPDVADAYLKSLTEGKPMTPYQQAQARLAERRFAFDQYKYQNPIARPKAAGGANDTGSRATAQAGLNDLRKAYQKLNQIGATVSPTQTGERNILARVRNSGVGQIVEGAIGTEAQTLRDEINAIRPGLMQAIAKATGMTGKQLDSNSDVKLFMQTTSNPASSYEANLKAIAALERLLGTGASAQKPRPQGTLKPRPKAPAASGGWGKAKVVGN